MIRLKHCVLLAGLGLIGCGGEAKIPVSGTVLHNDKPLPNVNVIMVRVDGKVAQGVADANGAFSSMTTEVPGDGAIAGKYKVGITPIGSATSQPTSAADYSVPPMRLFPEKFLSTETSGLEVVVEPNMKPIQLMLKD